ncbi:MAG TPA: SAM-dependent chlorinase/fluorinase [Thermoanaerobaculia bacterium]|nr:SAM-dependent chlorinase/fluorinase [Thermoanaerobaculia bacterium]
MTILTLTTDFGLDDWYVAAVKAVILARAPGTTLVDVTHTLPPGDVEGAAFQVGAASRFFPAGTVHLAVVDPGVGSERRILAGGARGGWFVAPDNGLLTAVLGTDGEEAAEVRAVERADLWLDYPGATFHGRDRFAPVAAWLLAGGDLAALGPEIDDPVRLAIAPPRRSTRGDRLDGRVVHVDRFGNLVTDLPTPWLEEGEWVVELTPAGGERHGTSHRATHYREIPSGEAAVLPGSLGTLELALDGDSLARRWGAGRGAPVTARRLR